MVGKKKPSPEGQQAGNVEEDLPMYYDKGKARLIDKILLSNKLRVGVVMFLAAVVMPLLVYAYIFDTEPRKGTAYGECNLMPEYRVPCLVGKSGDVSAECEKIGCCWDELTSRCHHSIPSDFEYLVDSSDTPLSFNLRPRSANSPLGRPNKPLACHFETVNENHLRIAIVELGSRQSDANVDLANTAFNATVYTTGFSVNVTRRDDNAALLLSTSHGPLIASDNYWEVTVQLPVNATAFGLGRLHLAHGADDPIVFYAGERSTGSHPVVICMDASGKAHGIYLENTGPLEILFMKDSNLLIVRSLSNEGFKINVFAGPTPKEVMRQLTDLIGRPKMPPYWALGLHVCRDSEVRIEVKAAVDAFLAFRDDALSVELPFDSHCVHERLLDEFTLDVFDGDLEAVNSALGNLTADGRKFFLTLPAPVLSDVGDAFTSAVAASALLLGAAGDDGLLEGTYRDRRVVYPDWESVGSGAWLADRLAVLQTRLGEGNEIAGIVLQDNWPPNEDNFTSEQLDYIPPFFNGSLSNGTLWWQARHADGTGTHSEVHNVYGLHHAAKADAASADNSTLLLSASTYPGIGKYAGAHHQREANTPAKWSSLKEVLTSVLGLGLAGIPLASGGSVCGSMADFNHTEHEALCLKWYLLSVSLPMIRASSVAPYRDPTSLSSGFTRKAVLDALRLRYTMLPYYYTVFHEAMLTGTPVARPMFLEFPDDTYARFLDAQFVVGSALMVAPVFVPGAVNVQVYLPQENTTWYRLVGGQAVNNGTGGHLVTISSLETEVLALLRGGYILPMQAPGVSTALSRESPHHLVVGLGCAGPKMDPCAASGRLYFGHDDASTTALDFEASRTNLTVSNVQSMQRWCGTNQSGTVLDYVSVYGYWRDAGAGGGSESDAVIEFNEVDSVLKISNLRIDLCAFTEDSFDVVWQ